MKDLLINKAQVDAALVKFTGFEIVKQSDAQYTLNIDFGGVLNIYFKKNGKTSFLSQGQDPLVATNFAQALINLIQFPKDADEYQELITIGSDAEVNPLTHIHMPIKSHNPESPLTKEMTELFLKHMREKIFEHLNGK